MSEAIDPGPRAGDSWSILARENWDTTDELLVGLTDAVATLDAAGETVLHDHIAVDAVLDALDPASPSRAVSAIQFEYGRYEIRVTDTGVIAVSPDPDAPPRPTD